MNIAQILTLYDEQVRIHADLAGSIREDTGEVVRYHYPNPERYASIPYSRLTSDKLVSVIEEQIQYFQGKAAALGWTVYSHDKTPPELAERLIAHNFEADEPAAVMVLDLVDLPDVLMRPNNHDIRRMSPGDDLHDVQTVLNAANGRDLSHVIKVIAKELHDTPQRLSAYAAYVDDQPVSCAWIRFPPGKFAGLYAGSTLPEFRNQGFYSALVAIRAQEAKARGYPFLAIDAGSMSQPIVERVGFKYLTTLTDYTYKY
jgi:GNAT superfamily N-acetyltransferase